MEHTDIITLCIFHEVDETNVSLWPSERTESVLSEQTTPRETEFYQSFIRAFQERYGKERGIALVFAIAILAQNWRTFYKHTIGCDEKKWLTKEIFHPIAQDCIDALNLLPEPEFWQVRLKEKFESFC